MYISPVNYKPKIVLRNNFNRQNNNINFSAKTIKPETVVKTTGILPALSVPLILKPKQNSAETVVDKTNNSTYLIKNNKSNKKQKKNVQQKHHPDFYKLQKEGYEILASSYFRRGGFYGCPSDKYVDVINALKYIFHPGMLSYYKEYGKVKMLVGGIGESQEPFSLLATTKSLIGKEQINDTLDMYTVDLQYKPDENTIFQQSFYDQWGEPEFVKSSFVKDKATRYELPYYKTYRVSDEIFEYLSDVYNNPKKARWKTKIQNALKEYPDNHFDIISINNTLMYINNDNERLESIKNIYRTLRRGGIFISDNRLETYKKIFTPENSIEIYPGIYKKL